MRAPTLRGCGFAATLLTGFALLGAGVGGLSSMDATLEVAAAPDRPTFVSHERGWGECDGRDDRRTRV